ncbi:hypothetical protein XANCAGTX0491_000146 [Xanthoria calcicola]
MDHLLPLELHHHIFALVDGSDIPNLRKTCRTFANVGLDYLLPEVEITFTRKSFEHLAQVVKHPILGRRVKSLIYHIDALKPHHNKDEWLREIGASLYTGMNSNSWKPCTPAQNAPEREWRLYRRNHTKACSPKWRFTGKQLATAHAAYKRLWAEQEDLRQDNFGIVDMKTIIAQLPNLKCIALSNYLEACTETNIVEETFKDTFVKAFGDEHYHNHCGVPQLLTLLHGLRSATANITLESLDMGWISWKILQESDENFELMREIFRPLKIFSMALVTSQLYHSEDPDGRDDEPILEGDTECQAFLDDGRHLVLLQSMSNLQVLALAFESMALSHFDLVSTFRDSYWPRLREVRLQSYQSTDEDLLEFLNRHVQTLKVVEVIQYRLLRGLWLDVFRGLRTTLDLVKFHCGGCLSNNSMPNDYWDFCRDLDGPISLGDLVETFVLGDEDTIAEDVLKMDKN